MAKILTVSIAAYNVEKFVSKAVDSIVLSNALNDIEILIENDGSTDNTKAIGELYQKKYPESVKLINKKNGGYGSTINCSIKEASGKYFKQLDGDDWFETENLVDYINLLKKTDADWVITPFSMYYEDTKLTKNMDLTSYIDEGFYDVNNIEFKEYVNMHSSTFRTQLLKGMPYKIRENCFYTDLEYLLYPLKFVKNVYISKIPIYVYRFGREGQSVSIEGICKHYKEHEMVLYDLINYYNTLENISSNVKDLILSRLISEIVSHMKWLCKMPFSLTNWKETRAFILRLRNRESELMHASILKSGFSKAMFKSDGFAYPILRIVAKYKE